MSRARQEELAEVLRSLTDQREWTINQIMPVVYEDLRLLARGRLRGEHRRTTFQTTDLVNEAYLRLRRIGLDNTWGSVGQFFCVAAEVMRQVLVDRARSRGRQKRGGNWSRTSLDGVHEQVTDDDGYNLLDLDDALKRLEQSDALLFRIVKLRFFGGLTVDQTAEVVDLPRTTVYSHWRYARAWLFAQLEGQRARDFAEALDGERRSMPESAPA